MTKLLTIFGATGNQGGSVAKYVAADPVLSKEYSIRAVTRHPQSPAAKALAAKGIEVVHGDLDDIESLRGALRGSHTVFGVTVTVYDEHLKERELRQGRALADLAVEAGAKYLIWSSLPSATLESNGKYTHVDSFDSKYEIEQYIRRLPIKSAFFAPASFMQNLSDSMAPRPAGDGTFVLSSIWSAETKIPWVDIEHDSGKYVGAILAEPDKFEGKVLAAATGFRTMEDVARILSRVTGKTVKFNQIPVDVFKGFLTPVRARVFVEMMLYIQEFGYYGSESREKVAWTASVARGKLTTLEEYFANNLPSPLA